MIVAVFCAAAAEPPKATSRTIRVPLARAEGELKPREIKATVSGKPARVVRVRTVKDDLLVLLVMDVVGDLSLVDTARNALAEQFQLLPKTTWLGLLRAQDGLQVLLDPTPDREKVASALRAMPVTGKAGLLDSLETALRLADAIAAKSAVRLAVLYITDSDVRNYRQDFTNPVINNSDSRDLSRRFPEGLIREKVAQVTASAARYQTPVFIVHLDYSSERLNEAYQSGLLKLSAATGGAATFARSQADVPGAIASALSSIQAMPYVWLQLPSKMPDNVQVALEAEGVALEYRTQFLLK